MRIQVKRRDAVWSFLGTLVSMSANLIILPVILVYLDDNSIGLYYVFSSLSAISALFDFGFSPSFARSVAYCWSGVNSLQVEGSSGSSSETINYGLLDTVLRTCKVVYLLLAMIALLLGATAGSYYIASISASFSGNDYMYAWILYLVAIVVNIYYGYYSVSLRGIGAVADVSKAMVFSRCLQIILCIGLTIHGCGLIGIAAAYLSYGFAFRVIAKLRFDKATGIRQQARIGKEKECKYTVKQVLMTIWPNTWRDGLVTLSNYLLNQATTIIASLYLSLYETGVYSLCVQLATAIVSIAATLYNTYQPALQSAYVNHDKNAQKKYMSMIVVTYCFVTLLGTVCVLTVGKDLIAWIKPSYSFSVPIMALMCFYQFMLKLRNCYATYFSTTNRLIYTKSFIISAFVCLVLSIVMCGLFNWGVYGLVCAQIVSQIVYNAWFWMIKAHQELNLGFRETFILSIDGLKHLLSNGK